ncbi:MBL fold metallo-hydrolase [Coraliomargarita sp. SDUM461003]|uniref:MBL fold metallo-hydrolase n=1 Tax=Thalassobacterium maritimum TaxID=3041265 RepID=A0ABU1AX64_9BACT|nr:MBL fold metallo-hydrolase [Coraliomargarita sp. SDUM461003]MBT63554.1 MBL fold metallo-hydrolase [Puniceicoccaceae bacterium]MDQ8208187.1 MBL fold metallo-hydrolase [Coraliomargarita sp. SDUM461003]HBR92898.1 MBL fold metallo-hydrolase [Opitutae bacterium]|tara:strand:+ start:3255 stop:4613 length:1359 start_codon:yes stop_codon:yes gene_type:complete
MKLTDLNRHGEIGANSMFVQLGDFNILIDSGLHPKKLGYDALPDFEPIENLDLDLIILTHCHLDHLGSMPIVTAHNPKTPVITAAPNVTLAPRMLRNSINVMKRQREEHGIAEYPLFLHRDVAQFTKQLTIQRFGRGEIYTKGKDQVEVILHCSGHVAGAAAVELIYQDRRVVFSGDVLFDAQRTLPGAELPMGPVDTLVLETTRGANDRECKKTRESEIDRLIEQIASTLERGGSCLIPVFALGRMQELFRIIYDARNAGRLPQCPIHAAGLGMAICEYFDKIRKQTNLVDFDLKMLEKMDVRAVDLNMRPGRDLPRKGIYLVSSGMMVEHTPSYKIAASLLPHPNNGLCFVGYCDPDSPGGQLLAERDEASFFFDALDYSAPIRASIDQFDLSGHADRSELLAYAEQSDARAIVLTHGDQNARDWFSQELTSRMPETTILDPEPLTEYHI